MEKEARWRQRYENFDKAYQLLNTLPLPEAVALLLWDVDLATLDLEAHKNYIIERVLNMGGSCGLKMDLESIRKGCNLRYGHQ